MFHSRLLVGAGAQVVSVVTRDPERTAAARADHPDVAVFSSVAELLAAHRDGSQPLDLLILAHRNNAHVPDGLAAVESRLWVVVDKPLAVTSSQAQVLVEAAQAAGVGLTVFQNRRRDHEMVTLRALMSSGALGTVHRFESRFERWRPVARPDSWREQASSEIGSGQLLDLGAHLIDQARMLFGPVAQVYAEVAAHRGYADDDAFVALTHVNGIRSHLSMGAVTAAPGPRFRVLGSLGAFAVRDLDVQEDRLREGEPVDAGWDSRGLQFCGELLHGELVGSGTPVLRAPGGWEKYYPQVFAALRSGDPSQLPVDPVDAVTTIAIVEAARLSSESGTVVVPRLG